MLPYLPFGEIINELRPLKHNTHLCKEVHHPQVWEHSVLSCQHKF